MLQLTHEQFARIVAQGLAGKPLEICGLLAGRREIAADGPRSVVTALYPARNDDQSPNTYTMNARDYMQAESAARRAGVELLGIYHTHPASPAYPSPTDVRQAHWGDSDDLTFPGFSYLIVSLRQAHNPQARSFKINGRRIPEDIEEETLHFV